MRRWVREPSLSIHTKVIDEYCLLGESCQMAHMGALMNRIPSQTVFHLSSWMRVMEDSGDPFWRQMRGTPCKIMQV
jgi:hypothetical protein